MATTAQWDAFVKQRQKERGSLQRRLDSLNAGTRVYTTHGKPDSEEQRRKLQHEIEGLNNTIANVKRTHLSNEPHTQAN